MKGSIALHRSPLLLLPLLFLKAPTVEAALPFDGLMRVVEFETNVWLGPVLREPAEACFILAIERGRAELPRMRIHGLLTGAEAGAAALGGLNSSSINVLPFTTCAFVESEVPRTSRQTLLAFESYASAQEMANTISGFGEWELSTIEFTLRDMLDSIRSQDVIVGLVFEDSNDGSSEVRGDSDLSYADADEGTSDFLTYYDRSEDDSIGLTGALTYDVAGVDDGITAIIVDGITPEHEGEAVGWVYVERPSPPPSPSPFVVPSQWSGHIDDDGCGPGR